MGLGDLSHFWNACRKKELTPAQLWPTHLLEGFAYPSPARAKAQKKRFFMFSTRKKTGKVESLEDEMWESLDLLTEAQDLNICGHL